MTTYELLRGALRPAHRVHPKLAITSAHRHVQAPIPIQINNHRHDAAVVIAKAKQLPAMCWEASNSLSLRIEHPINPNFLHVFGLTQHFVPAMFSSGKFAGALRPNFYDGGECVGLHLTVAIKCVL